MVAVIQVERHMANARIFGIIISELGHRQEVCTVILFKIDKGLEVGFYRAILTFGLAICLKMEDCEKLLFYSKEIAE